MSPRITYHKAIVANSYFIYVHIYTLTGHNELDQPWLNLCWYHTPKGQSSTAHRLVLQRWHILWKKLQCLLVPSTSYHFKLASNDSIEAQYEFEELRLMVLAGAKATGGKGMLDILNIIWHVPVFGRVGVITGITPGPYLWKNVIALNIWTVHVEKDSSNT